MSNLPPLPPPEPVMVHVTQGNRCAVHGTYTADQMTQYAKAAYRAGMERAAEICKELANDLGEAEKQRDAFGECIEMPAAGTVNRYCRAGMCLQTDAEHEPWCERHKTPNVRAKLPAAVR
ncbi:MAG: hypothetical protein ACK5OQ_16480 [Burkholderiales bacterium]